VLPDGLRNPRFEALADDHFFHIEDAKLNRHVDLRRKFGDVKFVLMGGAPDRMQSLAQKLTRAFGWPSEEFGSKERYAMHKVGPIMTVSHGIGMPSMSIVLHELTKVLHYSGCHDVTFIRIGTSGGIGVTPGTLVVASEGLNTECEKKYETIVLGKRKFYDTTFDARTAEELASAGKRAKLPVVVAKTLATNDYYEEQGRLDGAVETGYSEAEQMAWLQHLYDNGVRNMEMEATCLAAFCNRTGIRAGLICSALINRLKGDQTLDQATGQQIGQWNADAQDVVIEWLREKLSEGRGSALAKNQVTNCDQFVAVEEVPILDMKDWYSGTPEGRTKIVGELSRACQDVGFFFLRGHGMSDAVCDGIFDSSRRFFDQKQAEKLKFPMSKDYPYGYENNEVLVRSEEGKHGDTQKGKDLKETFTICLGPEGKEHSSMPAVRWPDGPDDLREKYTAYYRECERVVGELMKIAALALDLEENWFQDKLDHHIAALRSLNYPDTRDSPPAPGQLRASPHTDYGLFTLLRAKAEGSEGLQLMKGGDGWLDAKIPDDCFTVNIGDMFCKWTNDKWRSTRHRVIVKEGDKGNRRQSVAFFLNPNPDAMVSTLKSCINADSPNKYVDILAGDYLMLKHNSAMGYK
jgi:uridine phosphorylase